MEDITVSTDVLEASKALVCAILHTPEAKKAMHRMKVAYCRVVKHPSVRFLEPGLRLFIELPNGKAYKVTTMADRDALWVIQER